MDQIKVRLTVTKEGCQADEDKTPSGSQREDKHKKSKKDAQGQTITKTQQEAVTRKIRGIMNKKESPRDSGKMIKIKTSRKLNKIQHHDKGLCRKNRSFVDFFFFLRKGFQISWK